MRRRGSHFYKAALDLIEQKAYRDTWGKGLDSYYPWFYDTVFLLKDLLADDGSQRTSTATGDLAHYLKIIMDEVFGTR